MDDILSAALGQSGINLNFLETHQETGCASKPAVVPHDEGDEDVTDLLNLLNSDTTSDDLNGKNVVQSNMLDMVLNYQSDDENSSDVPSPRPQTQLKLPTNNIYTHTNHERSLSSFESSSRLKAFASPIQNRQLIQKNNKGGAKIQTVSPLLINKLPQQPRTQMQNMTMNVSTNNSLSQLMKSNSSSVGTIKVKDKVSVQSFDGKPSSDIEKRKQSIQHVLASPNLTVREKQFLMKSALSHQMIPTLSPISTK